MTVQKSMDKRLGLIGKNIAYSFSKSYFAQKFKQEGIVGYTYENFDLATPKAIPGLLDNPTVFGCNVTIPYKEAVMPYLHNLSPEAQAIGAVNTLVFDAQRQVTGHNTDGYGFQRALEEAFSELPERALILGTGGAAKAICYVLQKKGIAITTVSRTPDKAQLTYAQIDAKVLKQHRLIINCTPLGTQPNIDACPELPFASLTPQHLLFDLIYNPAETLFLKKGKKQGAQTTNGLKMLEYQAEKAWELWQV
jgi:shikimate dehydrogenase